MNKNVQIKWKLGLDRPLIVEALEERGWQNVDDENDDNYNFFWAAVSEIKHIFNPQYKIRLRNNQILNHFPNHFELTRKDLLVKNLKRFKPVCKTITLMDGTKMELASNIIPQTYILPSEYSLFVEEFTKNQSRKWIFKPAGKAQGKGIQIITKFSQVKSIPVMMGSSSYKKESFIISRYLDNPFLIEGKKFDLRTYVLVTSYRPLKVWRYREGFARVCFEEYVQVRPGGDPNKDLFSHLTNVSFQKYSSNYNSTHGGKWPLSCLMKFIERNHGRKVKEKLLYEMDRVYLTTLKSVQNVILNDKHCFELYGFDILIDKNMKPWLIEVNASPSMVATTKHDFLMKKHVINDLLNIVIPSNWKEDKQIGITSRSKEKKVGGFDLIYNESKDPLNIKMNRPKTSLKKVLQSKFYPYQLHLIESFFSYNFLVIFQQKISE